MMRRRGFLLLLVVLGLVFSACGTSDGATDIRVLEDAYGNLYAVSEDGETFLFYYPGNESESFVVPDGIETVAEDAFLGTSRLKELSFASSVTTVLCDFSGSFIEKLTIPETVKSYNANFNDCLALKELTICTDADSTAALSINNSGIEVLTLPASLTALSSPWFFDATGVREIHTYNGDAVADAALEAMCDTTYYMPDGLRTFGVDQLVGLGAGRASPFAAFTFPITCRPLTWSACCTVGLRNTLFRFLPVPRSRAPSRMALMQAETRSTAVS